MSRHVRKRSIHRSPIVAAVLTLLVAVTVFVNNPSDAAAAQITSAGPLEKVETTPDLNCAVKHAADSSDAFYRATACGTFVTDGTNLYGPAVVPAGDSATDSAMYVAWTPVSQVGPTGTGTAGDPFTLVTTATGGPFTVVQTDTYVVGQESYTTSIQVTSSTAVTATIYRAGDCYLQDSDSGRGELAPGNAPTCKARPDSANPDRIEQWYPLTPGSNYIIDSYSAVWMAVGSMQPFPDTIRTGDDGNYDNGGGLSWTRSLAAGASATFAHLTLFSPVGTLPVTVTKSVSPSTVAPGGTVTYTITLRNPSSASVPISSITDNLPDGFAYVSGSTTGVTTDDPTVAGQDLTWADNFDLPGGSVDTPGTISLTFQATASSVEGVYTNTATAVGSQGATVVPATDVAAVTVTTGTTPTLPPVTQPPATTVAPTTAPPTTVTPTTAPPTTAAPTTAAPTTSVPSGTTTTVEVDPAPAPRAEAVIAEPAYIG